MAAGGPGELAVTDSDKPNLPAKPGAWSKELIRAIADDIGKAVAHHIEVMYPAAVKETGPSILRSVRGCTVNEILALIEVSDEGAIVARLRDRKVSRRRIKAAYAKVRRP